MKKKYLLFPISVRLKDILVRSGGTTIEHLHSNLAQDTVIESLLLL